MKTTNNDGWVNLLSGLGTRKDKSEYTRMYPSMILDEMTLESIWDSDGTGHNIVAIPADDMTKKGYTVENDSENLIQKKLIELKFDSLLNEALKWRALYGGSLVVMDIDDGGNFSDPLKIQKIKSIRKLLVVKSSETIITEKNRNSTITLNNGDVETITINKKSGLTLTIHVSRCLIFRGELSSDSNNYWGLSELQRVYSSLRNLYSGIGHSAVILKEFIVNVQKWKNLKELLSANSQDLILERARAIDIGKSTLNSILLDVDEDFVRNTANVSGLSELLELYMTIVSGEARIPVPKLFGKNTSGLNNKGDENITNYYDRIESMQKTIIAPELNKLIDYINISLNNAVENPVCKFNSLYTLTDLEMLEIKERMSKIDDTYIQNSVLKDSEVRNSRFKNGYSLETQLEEDEFDEEDLGEEEDENETQTDGINS